jgi:plastocyanin
VVSQVWRLRRVFVVGSSSLAGIAGLLRSCRVVSAVGLLLLGSVLVGCAGEPGNGAGSASSASTASTAGSVPSSSSSSSQPAASVAQTPSVTASPSGPVVRTVGVAVRGRRVDPKPGSVRLAVGERVDLVVTSDVANKVHVHGFDVEKRVPAGGTVRIPLRGSARGAFEVETHDPELLLTKIVVR